MNEIQQDIEKIVDLVELAECHNKLLKLMLYDYISGLLDKVRP